MHLDIKAKLLLVLLASGLATQLPTPRAFANVVGNGTHTFSPVSGTMDFLTVHSSRVLPRNHYGLGLFINHAQGTLPYGKSAEDENSNGVIGVDLVATAALTNRFEFGVALPFVAHQQIDSQSTHSEFAKEGNSEVRLNGKFALSSSQQFGLALIGTLGYDRLIENPHSGAGTGMSYIFEVASDYQWSSWHLAGNLGYRVAPQGEAIEDALVGPDSNHALGSIAIGYTLANRRSQLVGEVYTRVAHDEQRNETNRSPNSTETIAAYRHKVQENTNLNAGLGTQIGKGFGTPSIRLFAGIHHVIAPNKPEPQSRRVVRKRPSRPKKAAPRVRAPVLPKAIEEDLPNYATAYTEPAAPVVPSRAPDETHVLNNVHFVFDSDSLLLRGGMGEIENLVNHLRKSNIEKVVIEGHTCWMGSDSYNKDLSFRRAQSIRAHLIHFHGFRADQIVAAGFGKQRPIADNTTEQGRRTNRRVEFKIYHLGH